ncbi:MAG TPA: diphosphate--fructose-6-phosphate 1-phosphotransferase [Candidatus Goldiibacteriota bacterium]|nr:diphosphate--fructose-6-phosphate 1-phosphotransferase [Candidatus Goldiibacteriota bacterium]
MEKLSALQELRLKYRPQLPAILKAPVTSIKPVTGKPTSSISDAGILKEIFDHNFGKPIVTFSKGKNPKVNKKAIKVGVVLSGGQAAGGHNVIAGLFDGLKKVNPKNKLVGFLGGPSGIIEGKFMEITAKIMDEYRNTGGFDMIQSGRTKIETPEQFEKSKETMVKNGIDALVVVGGDDSNTNAALLAEYFAKENAPVQVIGVPKTIDGDLKNEMVETSFGFDTATKIYSELVGNICRDVNSARKYWHFIRLMGRSASHITLEVAFQTQPNIALIGEEVLEKKMTLGQIIDNIASVIAKRAAAKKNFGVVLVPEGLIEFIPEFKTLIKSLNDILAANESELSRTGSLREKKELVISKLEPQLASLMSSLPEGIAGQLILDRDPHGNVMVSQIETEKLLVEMLEKKLKAMKKDGEYEGKFAAITHFFGYEGRCGFPTNFDTNYCYALGYNAVLLIANGFSGYMSSVRNLTKKPSQWSAGGVPLTMMMNIERRKGHDKPVIQKALVELKGKPFKAWAAMRDKLAINDDYLFPGPIQYYGPSELVDAGTKTLMYERASKK